MIGRDAAQAGVLSACTRIGLEGDVVKTGHFHQQAAEVVDHLCVALCLVAGNEGMDVVDRGPGNGLHLGGRVQLHRAGAERDHRSGERDVLLRQLVHVPLHLQLRMVRVEHWVSEVRRVAHELQVRCVRVSALEELLDRRYFVLPEGLECLEDLLHVLRRRGLVQRERGARTIEHSQIEPIVAGGSSNLLCIDAVHTDGIEEVIVGHIEAHGLQAK
mmetsp:Transcript_17577/g.68183  ORF Transcript_17577/g.68183 Transcript_17577/m.68183 type:complete len:216 (-) Transcript_17577:1276-1923(-)